MWLVLDDDRTAVKATHRDRTVPGKRPSNGAFNLSEIVLARDT
jgi:hypothetical protein